MAKDKIPGGYYIKARQIQNSEIAIAPPYVREIWDWLLREANHMDKKIHGKVIKRGQMFRTFKDIQEGLHWKVGFRKMTYKKWQIEKAMKFLREHTMIATMKATRGFFITIINYDFYQDPSNYNGQREQQREQQSADTKNNNDKNKERNKNIYSQLFTHWINQNIYNHRKNIYQSEMKTALNKYNFDEIKNAITNYAIILKDEKYYFNYRWTLGDFLKRGIDRFIDLDIAKGNFLKNQKGGSNGNRKQLQQQPKTESEYDHLVHVYRNDT